MKEEYELDFAYSWMEVGGATVGRGGGTGLLSQVYLFAWYFLAFLTVLLLFYG